VARLVEFSVVGCTYGGEGGDGLVNGICGDGCVGGGEGELVDILVVDA